MLPKSHVEISQAQLVYVRSPWSMTDVLLEGKMAGDGEIGASKVT